MECPCRRRALGELHPRWTNRFLRSRQPGRRLGRIGIEAERDAVLRRITVARGFQPQWRTGLRKRLQWPRFCLEHQRWEEAGRIECQSDVVEASHSHGRKVRGSRSAVETLI